MVPFKDDICDREVKSDERTCLVCGNTKPKGDFRKATRSGPKNDCLECEKTGLRCLRCNEFKPHDAFASEPRNGTGRKSYCNRCCWEMRREKMAIDPVFRQKIRDDMRAYGASRYAKKCAERDAMPHTCSICGEVKMADEFRRRFRVGLKGECLECEKIWFRCTKCKEAKRHDEFDTDATMGTGRKSWCRECQRSYERSVRANEEYRTKARAYAKERYQRPEVREKILAYNRAYFATEQGRAAIRKYANSAKGYAANARRRAREAALPSTLTEEEWQEIIRQLDYRCFYCRRAFSPEVKMTMDHRTAVSKGGGTTKENAVPSCTYCNLSKGDRDLPVTNPDGTIYSPTWLADSLGTAF